MSANELIRDLRARNVVLYQKAQSAERRAKAAEAERDEWHAVALEGAAALERAQARIAKLVQKKR